MQEKIISLGAEIVSTQPEIVTDDLKALMLNLSLLVIMLAGCALLNWAYENDYLVVGKIAGILSVLMVFGPIVAFVFFGQNPPQKETGATLYLIRVSDQTDVSAISEEFDVINYEDYPILTVKAKIEKHI